MFVFEKMSIRFFKQSPTSMNSGKMYIRHLFHKRGLALHLRPFLLLKKIVQSVRHERKP